MSQSRDAEIDELERLSFERYCRKVGRPAADVEAELMPQVQIVFEQRFAVAEGFGPQHARALREHYSPALARGYLAANRAVIETEREGYVQELVEAAPSLPIAYEHLSAFARLLHCEPPSPDNPASLQTFLERVPTINLYDQMFNAFVSGKTVAGGVPAVCVFPHLHGSLSILIDCVLPVVVEKSADFRPLDETLALARQPAFRAACVESLEIVCSERFELSDDVWDIERLTQWPGGVMSLDVTTLGGWSFVWFHEYAHLLLGHLYRQRGPELEHEADQFATTMLLQYGRKLGVEATTWMWTGATFVIIAMMVIERLRGGGASHPPTRERLDRFIGGDPWSAKIAERIAGACGIATMHRWKFGLELA
jgi:hypothetical protein